MTQKTTDELKIQDKNGEFLVIFYLAQNMRELPAKKHRVEVCLLNTMSPRKLSGLQY